MALLVLGSAPGARAAPDPVSISRIEARLFYDQPGTFSGDVLADPGLLPHNVVIGEPRSVATLLLVRVAGRPHASERADRRLRVVARWLRGMPTAGGEVRAVPVVLDATSAIPALDEGGAGFVGYWLANTGCSPVRIEAWVRTGRVPGPAMRVTIPFACNE